MVILNQKCLTTPKNLYFIFWNFKKIDNFQKKIEKFHYENLTSFFFLFLFSIANGFIELKAKKFVKLSFDENLNFDFRILRITFFGRMRHF